MELYAIDSLSRVYYFSQLLCFCFLTAPLFVFQWLYDKAQLAWVLSGINVTREKDMAKIAIKLGKKMNESLSNTDGLAW